MSFCFYAVYRVVPKLHPLEFKHWDAMDDWWQYIAVDPCNGAVFAYRSEPKLVDGFWNAVVDGFWNDDARHCKRLDGILKFDLINVDKTVYIKRPQ